MTNTPKYEAPTVEAIGTLHDMTKQGSAPENHDDADARFPAFQESDDPSFLS